MFMTPVTSSNVHSLGWNQSGLAVKFHSSPATTYFYKGVPQAKFVSGIGADSVGKFVNEAIKPHYDFVKYVEGPTVPAPTLDAVGKWICIGVAAAVVGLIAYDYITSE